MDIHEQSQSTNSLPSKRGWKIWWELIRPHTLTASFVPVLLGTVLALLEGEINLFLFAAMLLASLFIQAATNLFNEYYDFVRGLDTKESVGIGGGIVRYGMTPKLIMNLALSMYFIALLLGIYICIMSSWWIAVVGLVCMAVGYLYTGGPIPISSTPFGELFSGLFMGFLIILITFFIQTGFVSQTAILTAIPIGVLVGLINLGNNLRDHDGDKANGRKTLPIVLGPKNAIIFLGIMYGFSYLWLIYIAASTSLTPWVLLACLSIPKAIQAVNGFIGKTTPISMMPAMKAAAQTNTFYGLLLAIGIFMGYVL
ncbi:1,4-dihydroxy-2-naphthoate polyprenyltransferase [Alteribacillus iranensis]|uniref:1,4-dihydroxy-2-naphthoate octaprenyltransferase n=1 Tax=Alteribacillus iranensis TaxID=930128 RepID=A0A1I2A0X4_9BACI|nr:1,4-dihydroxy-2-naphthoate polyprenyltransferase [Alteribacillus iranensis]SFE37258.1 1,4-dihydroxy-2-naphthoate prenyltransferase [Alteribacillus iranensis]